MKAQQITRSGRLGAAALAAMLAAGCMSDTEVPTGPDNSAAVTSARGGIAGAPTEAVVRFGNPDAGTEQFGPTHPSAHSIDNIIPNAVVIRAGGTVTFEVVAPHVVAIYEPGTTPEDIRLIPGVTLVDHAGPSGPPFIPNFYIDEPNGRLFLDPAPAFGPPHSVQYTFDEPGRYLVICRVAPHFALKMYAWVEVK
jgi:plastocyanin